MNKRKTAIFAAAALVVIAMIILSASLNKDKNEFEAYLSGILCGRVSILVSNIDALEQTLTEVIEYQTVTSEQAAVLYRNSSCMKDREIELSEMGTRLGKLKRNQIDKAITTVTKMSEYFKKLYKSLSEEDIDHMTQAQQEGFQEFRELLSLYKAITISCVRGVTDKGIGTEYWNEYSEEGINKKYWVELISRLEEASPVYSHYALLNRRTDIWNVE